MRSGTGRTDSRRANTREGDYYIDGNTVRRSEAVPDYRKVRQERIEEEREAEQRRKRRIARRNRERELRMSRSYVFFLSVAVVVFGMFTGGYIKVQSEVTARMRTISKLESQINDLKADNDEAYKKLNTSVDLEEIKNRAITELGMFYAKEAQIIYYSVGDDDYMNQYGEIPDK